MHHNPFPHIPKIGVPNEHSNMFVLKVKPKLFSWKNTPPQVPQYLFFYVRDFGYMLVFFYCFQIITGGLHMFI